MRAQRVVVALCRSVVLAAGLAIAIAAPAQPPAPEALPAAALGEALGRAGIPVGEAAIVAPAAPNRFRVIGRVRKDAWDELKPR